MRPSRSPAATATGLPPASPDNRLSQPGTPVVLPADSHRRGVYVQRPESEQLFDWSSRSTCSCRGSVNRPRTGSSGQDGSVVGMPVSVYGVELATPLRSDLRV